MSSAHPAGGAASIEIRIGIEGATSPGIHTPEALLDPAYAVERLVESGATFVGS